VRTRQAKAIIVGAGPAGLTAAYQLSKSGETAVVLESDPEYVGGISRTVSYRGYRFDIGGHRFFSKSSEVENLWTEILGADMLQRPRSSKIHYQGQFYSYPLEPLEALSKLGLLQSTLSVLSFLRARLQSTNPPRTFEDWVVNQFGRRLFRIFFKTYTEKVWGMSCKEISADWAAQRIKGLSLGLVLKNSLFPRQPPVDRTQVVKTLIDTFRYPRLGPGMMWERCAERIREMGGLVLLGRRVEFCEHDRAKNQWLITTKTPDGQLETYTGEHLISSMPIQQLVSQLSPELPQKVRQSGESLRYRDFLTVGLILRERHRFADHWLYVHDPNVKVGRIQNYKSWSTEMVPNPNFCSYGLEYFCFEGDSLWNATDAQLLELAKRELQQIKLARASDVVDGCVIRQPKAYPVYDGHYKQHLAIVRDALTASFPTLHLVGRNGLHRYNNQDHAMTTAMVTARNIVAGFKRYDTWAVGDDCEYGEPEGSAAAGSHTDSINR